MNKVVIIAIVGVCGLIGLEWYVTHCDMSSWNWALRGFTSTWLPIIYTLILLGYVWKNTEGKKTH